MKRLLRPLALLLLLSFGAALFTPAAQLSAQPVAAIPDYEDWQRTAARADEAIEASRASTPALEALRQQLVNWREQFVEAQGINANAISTVQSQLDALGPVPENGEEPATVASQRADLNARLAELQEPAKTAELAQNRADGLIRGIDNIIRDRQADELLEFGPSPVNPVNWAAGLSAVSGTAAHVRGEFKNAWNNSVQRAEAQEDLPAVILLAGIGLLLIIRGRRWSRRLSNWVLTEQPGAGRWIGGFALSLGSVLLPFAGVVMLTESAFATNLIGLRSEQMISGVLGPVFVYLLARWLAMRIFPAREARTLPLTLEPAQRQAGRFYGASLGAVAGAYFFVSDLSGFANWTETATNVVLFPFIAVAGLMLLRLARLLQLHCKNAVSEDGEESYRNSITRFLALAMAVLGVVSPVLAAVGYFKLAHFLMFPSLLSLQLMAVLLVLQRVVVEVYVLVTGNREGATDSLVPVVIGLIMVLLSLPFFAMAWGVRPSQLLDLWTRFTEGVNLGGVRISPTVFLTFAIVFAIGYIATRLLQGTLKNTILPKTRIDQGGRNAIVAGVGYVGIFLAAVVAITSAGVDLSSIAIVAGALSVGIGFGLRTIVENFVSGIILLIERPISEGDWIEVGGVHGTVRDISVRSTRIETFDRSDVILPNADLVAGRVTNYTRFNTVGRAVIPVGVAYGTDTKKVESILMEIAEAHPMVLANPGPSVVFKNFGADSLDFEIRAILRDVNWVLSVTSDINHEIARRFAEEGVEIPFAQRDIWIRNPEALTGEGAAKAAPAAPAAEPVQEPPKDTALPGEGDMPESDGEDAGGGEGDSR
ncbi:mechanosensitive ion channel family protein [Roseovarius faecimaris]|uniref:Mechanosensitive ion channel family protein n=1 Tax=Roseovarius faecimaris TaxID=2494550 RepID=A0A6I6IS55_9RHOB|nr:DUF3772 domain-containing protein [Roseovarius faecimaris]QGX98337.1 mechanosensitive ion channel family protein [Roseovarius faecimaris]